MTANLLTLNFFKTEFLFIGLQLLSPISPGGNKKGDRTSAIKGGDDVCIHDRQVDSFLLIDVQNHQ